jgi:hypothetical protein
MTHIHSHTDPNTHTVSHLSPTPRPARRHRVLGALAGTVLLAGSAVVAGHASASADRTDPCAVTAGGSPDSLERQALACRAELLIQAVHCLRSTSGTPNAVERWTAYCIDQVAIDE